MPSLMKHQLQAAFLQRLFLMATFLRSTFLRSTFLKGAFLHAWCLHAGIWAALLLVVGCQPEEPLSRYSVARTAPPRPPLDTEAILQQLDHILVAIVPREDQAWFFKMAGKAPAIGRQRQAFRDFLATVTLAETSKGAPSWELPAGWKEGAATAMRAATLIVPDSDGALEIAVSSLPLTEGWESFLEPNVNRWLGQLQQKPLPRSTILQLAQQAPTRDGKTKATLFELSGAMAQQRPMGGDPHAGLDISRPASTAPQPGATQQPLTYTTPTGWQPGKLSTMRKAAFLLPSGQPSDEVTVMSFPDTAQMANVAANVQRWAGQVGRDPPSEEDLDKLTEPITVSGIKGTYVELVSPPESTRDVALFAVMVRRDGQVWFFKMIGRSEVVSSQRTAFREFLNSVQIL